MWPSILHEIYCSADVIALECLVECWARLLHQQQKRYSWSGPRSFEHELFGIRTRAWLCHQRSWKISFRRTQPTVLHYYLASVGLVSSKDSWRYECYHIKHGYATLLTAAVQRPRAVNLPTQFPIHIVLGYHTSRRLHFVPSFCVHFGATFTYHR